MVISAVVSGADSWTEIETFGNNQIEWLRKFMPFKSGIPSYDTLGRFFSVLDFEEFSLCFSEWVTTLSNLTNGEVVAIDGKRLRGSSNKYFNKKAIHMVSAFASQNSLCLGQVAFSEKSNEITAIPALLNLVAVKGCTVTIDAMGCQTSIASKIRKKKADYILAVKNNQKELFQQIEKVFSITEISSENTDIQSGHGRVETRKCSVIDNLNFLDISKEWKDLKTIIRIKSERYLKLEKKTQRQIRFYISNLPANAQLINEKIRHHWSIENNLHWTLDVTFKEDGSQRRKGNSAKNFNIIAKIGMALIEREKSVKISKKRKRFTAALDYKFREKILNI